MIKTKILCILDGFGLSHDINNNCIAAAKMPNLKKAFSKYKMLTLDANGISVGQEHGLVGNSEVGHMNIGGLKKIPQLSYQITESGKNIFKPNNDIAPDQNFDPSELIARFYANKKHNELTMNQDKAIHIVSLFSSGRIHSDLRHIKAAIESSINAKSKKIILHLITDGRDADKKSFFSDYTKFKNENKHLFKNVYIGSVSGRFFAMDRDNNRDRILKACEAMFCPIYEGYGVNKKQVRYYTPLNQYFVDNLHIKDIDDYNISYYFGEGKLFNNHETNKSGDDLEKIINYNYSKENFDEYIEPISITDRSDHSDQKVQRNINPGDTIWFINYRTDRFKQLVGEFLKINKELNFGLNIIANNNYGIADFKPLEGYDGQYNYFNPSYYCIFEAKTVKNPLSKVLSKNGFSHLHISETEKFNHVTYFFNGGQNKKWDNEAWHVKDSNKVKSHAEKPEMKAKEITDYIIKEGIGKYDFIVVNYPNPDMVGHTGDFEAGVKSMELLDFELGRLISEIEKTGEMIITADHGNIEKVGQYHDHNGKILTDTEHNPSPVPCLIVSNTFDSSIDSVKKKIFELHNNFDVEIDKITYKKVEKLENYFDFLDIKHEGDSIILNKNIDSQFPLYINGVLILALISL